MFAPSQPINAPQNLRHYASETPVYHSYSSKGITAPSYVLLI